MVSKSKTLGQPTLILISVGSTNFPFLRLFSILKQLNKNKYKIFRNFMPPNQFINSIKKADKIIIHGGPATIFLAVKNARFMPLIIPRLAKYKEHVDNHQLFFTKYLRNKLSDNLKKYFLIDEKIDNVIDNYLKEKNEINNLNKFLFLNKDENKLVKNLEDYINKLYEKDSIYY